MPSFSDLVACMCRESIHTFARDSCKVIQDLILRVSSISIPGAAVASAQFTEGDQFQVKFILQLSGLLPQICITNTHKTKHHSEWCKVVTGNHLFIQAIFIF